MSRTRRKDFYVEAEGKPLFGKPHHVLGDRKKWYKPGKTFKSIQKKRRKAKEKDAMRHDPESVPVFKREDQWLYL